MRQIRISPENADNNKDKIVSGGDMNCKNCPDREICFHFNLLVSDSSRNYNQLKDDYLRTLRCRRRKFG